MVVEIKLEGFSKVQAKNQLHRYLQRTAELDWWGENIIGLIAIGPKWWVYNINSTEWAIRPLYSEARPLNMATKANDSRLRLLELKREVEKRLPADKARLQRLELRTIKSDIEDEDDDDNHPGDQSYGSISTDSMNISECAAMFCSYYY